jgi:hypothetical protein
MIFASIYESKSFVFKYFIMELSSGFGFCIQNYLKYEKLLHINIICGAKTLCILIS